MTTQPVLIDGEWRNSVGSEAFSAVNPRTCEPIAERYPVSPWAEVDAALDSAWRAFETCRAWPGDRFANFLEAYASQIESRAERLIEAAHHETGLPVKPRLQEAELPRTTNQLRQAAAAAREGSWSQPTIDTKSNIRSMLGPIGPVAVFGPNNFPFAFNGAAGGDFAAAVAAGNPVIAKGHSSHPATTRLFAEAAQLAATETQMPAGFVQLIYRTSHADGLKLAADRRLGAIGYTGARAAGLQIKAAADRVGKPVYVELSSVNPVVFLPGSLQERSAELAEQFAASCLMGTGQFCTNPGLVLLTASQEADAFIAAVAEKFQAAPVGTMLSGGVQTNFLAGIKTLVQSGATVLAGGTSGGGTGFSCANTLLRVSGEQFLKHPDALQTEAFGNGSLVVVANSFEQLLEIAEHLEGNLTGTIYSANDGRDDSQYDRIAAILRIKVGRLLNDKMPTGVAVVSSMNHGGPFPATGHPGFTAVGIPASLRRFSMLHCYDNVRSHRLPAELQNANPTGKLWRLIDGQWSRESLSAQG